VISNYPQLPLLYEFPSSRERIEGGGRALVGSVINKDYWQWEGSRRTGNLGESTGAELCIEEVGMVGEIFLPG